MQESSQGSYYRVLGDSEYPLVNQSKWEDPSTWSFRLSWRSKEVEKKQTEMPTCVTPASCLMDAHSTEVSIYGNVCINKVHTHACIVPLCMVLNSIRKNRCALMHTHSQPLQTCMGSDVWCVSVCNLSKCHIWRSNCKQLIKLGSSCGTYISHGALQMSLAHGRTVEVVLVYPVLHRKDKMRSSISYSHS